MADLIHQTRPCATERLLDTLNGRDEHIDVSSLNLLQRPQMQVHHLSQPFLRHGMSVALTPHSSAKALQGCLF